MKVVVLKAFPYAHNGIETADQPVGAEIDVRDELVPGLKAAGYLGDVAPQKTLPGSSWADTERGPQNDAPLGVEPNNSATAPAEQPADAGSVTAEHPMQSVETDTVPQRRRRKRS